MIHQKKSGLRRKPQAARRRLAHSFDFRRVRPLGRIAAALVIAPEPPVVRPLGIDEKLW
jgi:hypothetical protein